MVILFVQEDCLGQQLSYIFKRELTFFVSSSILQLLPQETAVVTAHVQEMVARISAELGSPFTELAAPLVTQAHQCQIEFFQGVVFVLQAFQQEVKDHHLIQRAAQVPLDLSEHRKEPMDVKCYDSLFRRGDGRYQVFV